MKHRLARAIALIALSIAGAFGAMPRAHAKDPSTPTAVAPKKLALVADAKNAGAALQTARKVVPDGWDAHADLEIPGKSGPLWIALDSPKLRKAALERVHAALAGKQLDAALLVHVATSKKARVVRIVLVVQGEDDAVLDEKVTLPVKPSESDAAALRAIVAPPLTERAPKATAVTSGEETKPSTTEAAPAPEVAPPDQSAAAAEASSLPATSPREPMLTFSAMGELAARRFTYDGQTIGGLRPYNLPNVAAIGVAVELMPLRDAKSLVSGLGVAGDFHTSLGLKSTSVGSSVASTARWTRFDGVLRWWLPLTASHVTSLGVSLGYGQERFAFSPPTPDLPSVAYHYARGGVDLRFRLGKGDPTRGAAVFVGASYLMVLSGGDVAEHFRRAQTWGLEFTGGLSVYLSAAIELRLAVDYRRYSQRFGGAQAGDPYIAAGALDEMVRTIGAFCVKY